MDELQRVLFVGFPDPRTLSLIGSVPVHTPSDEADGELPADGVVAIKLFSWQRIEVEAHTLLPSSKAATHHFKTRRVVRGWLRNQHPIGRLLGQAEPETVGHHARVARLGVTTIAGGHQRERLSGSIKSVDLHAWLGILLARE